MNKQIISTVATFAFFLSFTISPAASAQSGAYPSDDLTNQVILGFKIRAGGRFDNVRMCVATPAGVKGGPAADVSFYAEVGLSKDMSIVIDVPVMRPILFAAAFQMLQFEPEVTLLFRRENDGRVDLVAGPTLGLVLHYGPDYNSEASGDGRTESFFAMGPFIGGYFGLDFKRPNESYNFQLGLQPYVAPLFSINDPEEHKGVVVGGLLDFVFKYR